MWNEEDLTAHKAKRAHQKQQRQRRVREAEQEADLFGRIYHTHPPDYAGPVKGKDRKFYSLLVDKGLPLPHREWQFHHERRWRIDYAWPDPEHMVALEVEGGAWMKGNQGAHTTGTAFEKDIEKYNELVLHGFHLIRCVPKDLVTDDTIACLRKALLLPS